MAAVFRIIAFVFILVLIYYFPATAKNALSPPSPPEIYDPNPGPYLIFPDENGDIVSTQREFVDYIVSAWSGPALGAFSICYVRDGEEEIDWGLVKTTLDRVAASLKNAGARDVFTLPVGICRDQPEGTIGEQQPHVQITGVIKAR
ncbi:hypothetical protein LCM19_06295 [Qipengyuania flava]|nr:hypothetical protein [Qipengyuania flava]